MNKFFNKFTSFLLTLFLIVILRLYLSFFGFGKLIRFLKRIRSNILSIDKLGYVVRSIQIICLVIPNITCLIRAAVLKVIFNETEGLEMIIGINSDKNKSFESHAWVSLNKKVILNDDLKIKSYKTIYTL